MSAAGIARHVGRRVKSLYGQTVIVGLDNPQSDDPEHALCPWPTGCSGWRLCQLMNLTQTEYLRLFQRRNLRPFRAYGTPVSLACKAADMLVERPRRVLALGREVAEAFGLSDRHLLKWTAVGQTRMGYVPHPSGRNRWYNVEANETAVREYLETLVRLARREEKAREQTS